MGELCHCYDAMDRTEALIQAESLFADKAILFCTRAIALEHDIRSRERYMYDLKSLTGSFGLSITCPGLYIMLL
jgi:hypothetical protein